jgi:uridine kinase
MIIIGISGKKGRGKDTVAGIIQELRKNCKNYHFALKLKQRVCSEFNLDLDFYNKPENKEIPIKHMPSTANGLLDI